MTNTMQVILVNHNQIVVKGTDKDYLICQEGKGFGLYEVYHEKRECELTNTYYIMSFENVFQAMEQVQHYIECKNDIDIYI